MSFSHKKIEGYLAELKQPNAVAQETDNYYILYRHGRWHNFRCLGSGRPNYQRYIDTLYFYQDHGIRQLLSRNKTLQPISTIDQMFFGFENEVTYKILPKAKDYLPLVMHDKVHALLTPFTTDSEVESRFKRDTQFIDGLQKVMDNGVPGFALVFTGPAPTNS